MERSERCEDYCFYEFGAESCDAFGAPCVALREERKINPEPSAAPDRR